MTSNLEEFWNFLGSWFPDADLEGVDEDDQVVRNFIAMKNVAKIGEVRQGLEEVLHMEPLPAQRVAHEANRHFENESECRMWLISLLNVFAEYRIN